MNRTVNIPVAGFGARPGWEDVGNVDWPVQSLSREEAQALRKNLSFLSPWAVVAAQGAVGLVCGAAFGLFSQDAGTVWSSLYGAAAVVLRACCWPVV